MNDWVCSSEEMPAEGNERYRIYRTDCSPSTTYGRAQQKRYVRTTYQIRDAETYKLLDAFDELDHAREDAGNRYTEYLNELEKKENDE